MQEDLELDVVQDDMKSLYTDYAYEATFKGEPFWIIYDADGFKKEAGFAYDEYSAFESFLDELYEYNWGYEESWTTCIHCGEAIYLDDYTNQDYWLDSNNGTIYCGECIRTEDDIARDYLEWLTNNPNRCNDFLSDERLRLLGLIQIESGFESGYYGQNDSPAIILNGLLEKYPYGQFIFSFNNRHTYGYNYDVWAFPGYEEGAIENEKE